jgi:hypothetical protein
VNRRDFFVSRAGWTGATQKGQIWEFFLPGFISRIFIKKAKIEKNRSSGGGGAHNLRGKRPMVADRRGG